MDGLWIPRCGRVGDLKVGTVGLSQDGNGLGLKVGTSVESQDGVGWETSRWGRVGDLKVGTGGRPEGGGWMGAQCGNGWEFSFLLGESRVQFLRRWHLMVAMEEGDQNHVDLLKKSLL